MNERDAIFAMMSDVEVLLYLNLYGEWPNVATAQRIRVREEIEKLRSRERPETEQGKIDPAA